MNHDTQHTINDIVRYLSFSLNLEEYAIPLLTVKEVIALPDCTPVPHTPAHYLGIINLRGQVMSIIDLRLKLGIKIEVSDKTTVIICDLNPLQIGIAVSAVNNVLALAPQDIAEKPDVPLSKSSQYITGVAKRDKKMILLLDLAKALDVENLTFIKTQEKIA